MHQKKILEIQKPRHKKNTRPASSSQDEQKLSQNARGWVNKGRFLTKKSFIFDHLIRLEIDSFEHSFVPLFRHCGAEFAWTEKETPSSHFDIPSRHSNYLKASIIIPWLQT